MTSAKELRRHYQKAAVTKRNILEKLAHKFNHYPCLTRPKPKLNSIYKQ